MLVWNFAFIEIYSVYKNWREFRFLSCIFWSRYWGFSDTRAANICRFCQKFGFSFSLICFSLSERRKKLTLLLLQVNRWRIMYLWLLLIFIAAGVFSDRYCPTRVEWHRHYHCFSSKWHQPPGKTTNGFSVGTQGLWQHCAFCYLSSCFPAFLVVLILS